jgi:SAM-dependent methyltransferase
MAGMNDDIEDIVRKHGPWTAMAIRLGDGSYTREPVPDYRLRRLLQAAQDMVGKPLSQCRVLDLACLEGHYAIEFAMHGAEALGIEGRAASVAKCEFARRSLGLERVRFEQGDVRHLSRDKHGVFDIVICSGLLYHLPAHDGQALIAAMFDTCSRLLIVDTFISLQGRSAVDVNGIERRGHYYGEHLPNESEREREGKLWASLDNDTSFWFTEPSLMNMLAAAGFTSVTDVLEPNMPGNPRDRKTYIAVKGTRATVLSSESTDRAANEAHAEGPNNLVDASQEPPGPVFLAAKHLLPQSIKDVLKPGLRALGVLPSDTTPAFQRGKPPTEEAPPKA